MTMPKHVSNRARRDLIQTTALTAVAKKLAQNEPVTWTIHGTSMAPTLIPDCTITIGRRPEIIALGSIVVFADANGLIAHRLVARRYRDGQEWLITQGDGRWTADPPILFKQIVGVVTQVHVNHELIWPRRYAGFSGWFWIGRYHLLRIGAPILRPIWRGIRQIVPSD